MMRRAVPLGRIGRAVLLAGLALAWASGPAAAQSGDDAPPAFPPGVRLLTERELPDPPLHGRVAGIEVDWNHPLLRCGAARAPEAAGADLPARDSDRWPRGDKVGAGPELWIQLLEPYEPAGENEAAPTADATPSAMERANGQSPEEAATAFWYRALTGGDLPLLWLDAAHGIYPQPASPGDPLWPPPPPNWFTPVEWRNAPSGPHAEATAMGPARWSCTLRWLGRGAELAQSLPDLPFRDRALVSLSDPAHGATRWLLLMRDDARPDNLHAWRAALANYATPRQWLAVHACGPQVRVACGDWRLGGPGDSRHSERLGAALVLRGLMAGEAVDWARLAGAVTRASSFEPDAAPDRPLNDGWWPADFTPRGWLSRAPRAHAPASDNGHWWEIDLEKPRPVQRVLTLGPGSVAGELAPPLVTTITGDDAPLPVSVTGATTAGEHDSGVPLRRTGDSTLRRLRVTFQPAEGRAAAAPAFDDGRARLWRCEAWGPWDGVTPPAPRVRP